MMAPFPKSNFEPSYMPAIAPNFPIHMKIVSYIFEKELSKESKQEIDRAAE